MLQEHDLSYPTEPGAPLPGHTIHAVSVCIPTWQTCVDFCEGEDWINSKIVSAYPRMLCHWKIRELFTALQKALGQPRNTDELVFAFASRAAAQRCADYISKMKHGSSRLVEIMSDEGPVRTTIYALFFSSEDLDAAKLYWRVGGDGITSRCSEYLLAYSPICGGTSDKQAEYQKALETQRINLTSFEEKKLIIKERIAKQSAKTSGIGVKETDVYLYNSGMSAIFQAQLLAFYVQDAEKRGIKSVLFNVPFRDTLTAMDDWGYGFQFLFNGSEAELDELEAQLKDGQLISMLLCEVPSNPLLHTPNMPRIRSLADQYNFIVVVDDTIGDMYNVDVLSYADIVATSLTKIFNGNCDLLAGSMVLNPTGKFYANLVSAQKIFYTDDLWAGDAITLEFNSRDVEERNKLCNRNAEAVVDMLLKHPLVKEVYYPKCSDTRQNYDRIRTPDGGYGCLFSVVMKTHEAAVAFFDGIDTAKGPSLGTNFTLASPFALLVHHAEVEFAKSIGVDLDLVRISMGIEELDDAVRRIRCGLERAEAMCLD